VNDLRYGCLALQATELPPLFAGIANSVGVSHKGAAKLAASSRMPPSPNLFRVVGQSDSSIGCGLAVWVASASWRNNRAAIREPQLIR
jgi:hypothetical protein